MNTGQFGHAASHIASAFLNSECNRLARVKPEQAALVIMATLPSEDAGCRMWEAVEVEKIPAPCIQHPQSFISP